MNYKIVVDSCCDLTEEMKSWDNLTVVPLTLEIGEYKIQDDSEFNQDDFVSRVSKYSGIPKSACPSPDAFANACEGDEENVFIITITDKLSGCFNSAVQGKGLFEEDNESSGKNIHIFNSLATSGLETLMAYKIKELADSGKEFDEIVSEVEDYCVNSCGLYFCLESLDALKGNGRLFNLAAKVIEALRVKLICKRTSYGNIEKAGHDLTVNRALKKIAELIKKDCDGKDLSNKTVIISHVCCEDKAKQLKENIEKETSFKEVIILKCSGLNSLYASNGGIIVSFDK